MSNRYHSLESGLFQPRQDNMQAIKSALEALSINLLASMAFKIISRTLEGDTMYTELWDDIFETLKDTGGEVCIGYVDEREPAEQNYDNLVEHLDRLKEHSINERLLVCEGDSYFIQDPSRVGFPIMLINQKPFFIYKTKVAIQFWNGKTTIIIDNPDIAKLEQERFDHLWSISRIPDTSV